LTRMTTAATLPDFRNHTPRLRKSGKVAAVVMRVKGWIGLHCGGWRAWLLCVAPDPVPYTWHP